MTEIVGTALDKEPIGYELKHWAEVTCNCDDSFRLLRVAGLVDEDVGEVVVGKVGRGHSTGSDQSHNQNPKNNPRIITKCFP